MHFSKLEEINLRSLDNLNLSNFDVLDWINSGNFLGDLLLDDIGSEKIQNVGGTSLGDFLADNVADSSSDFLLL